MESINLKRLKLEFVHKLDSLEDSELPEAYKSLKSKAAPEMCLQILVEQMVHRLGYQEAIRTVLHADFNSNN